VIEVLAPGLFTTVQDAGRPGWRAFGMPVAGAMDAHAHAVANLLAGNAPGAAALELTLSGGSYRFGVPAYAAVAGADLGATLDGVPVRPWSAFAVPAGATLGFGSAREGVRAYLAVRGGLDVPEVMGSRSTYARAAVGGLAGRALRRGDRLAACAAAGQPPPPRALARSLVPAYGGEIVLRAVPGPQQEAFTPAALERFFEAPWRVTDRNDRMGYRLDGPALAHVAGADIVSDPVLPGAVQVPADGLPIVLGVDAQTVGGYAKIATVIGPDLPRLAQARGGAALRFRRASEAEAVAARAEAHRALELLAASLGG
jgi:biotin-dependent carboxylase-like uncharacterized protein